METASGSSPSLRSLSGGAGSCSGAPSWRYTRESSSSNFLHSPIAAILEYSGIFRHPNRPQNERLFDQASVHSSSSMEGDASIRIIGSGDQYSFGLLDQLQDIAGEGGDGVSRDSGPQRESVPTISCRLCSAGSSLPAEDETGNGDGGNDVISSYHRYDIRQAARKIERILPFSFLILLVFIRQHLQGTSFS